jgi:hypothetical protein
MITALSEPVPLTDGQLRSVALSMGIGECWRCGRDTP